MSTNYMLPEPKTETIKIGALRRNRRLSIRQYELSNGCKVPAQWKGTPLGRRQLYNQIALFYLIFFTRDEIEKKVGKYKRARKRWKKGERKRFRKEGRPGIENYLRERMNEVGTISVPIWLFKELETRFGIKQVERSLGGAAIFNMCFFVSDQMAHSLATEFLRRDAERRAIDDEAHATLTSIMSGEAVPV